MRSPRRRFGLRAIEVGYNLKIADLGQMQALDCLPSFKLHRRGHRTAHRIPRYRAVSTEQHVTGLWVFPTENSFTDVMLVLSADDRAADGGAASLNYAPGRRILGQPQVSSEIVVARRVISKHEAQVRLTTHDEMVEAFATNRADQSLSVAVLPG